VVLQDAADRVRRDAFDHAVTDELAGQLAAVPLGQGAAELIRPGMVQKSPFSGNSTDPRRPRRTDRFAPASTR
jgi:hypothetical protein